MWLEKRVDKTSGAGELHEGAESMLWKHVGDQASVFTEYMCT